MSSNRQDGECGCWLLIGAAFLFMLFCQHEERQKEQIAKLEQQVKQLQQAEQPVPDR